MWPTTQVAVVVVEPEDERADGALLLAEAEGHHHCVERADPLDLHHPDALAGPVGSVALLCDHALAHAGEPLAGLVDRGRRLGELDRLGDDGREPLAALVVGELEQALVVLCEQVERDQLRRGLLGEHLHP